MMLRNLQVLIRSSKQNRTAQNGSIILSKLVFIFGLIMISTLVGRTLNNLIDTEYRKDITVANFRTDATIITEVGTIIEITRNREGLNGVAPYGGKGEILKSNEIKNSLKKNISYIGDLNKDNAISEEELNNLGLMKLDIDLYKKELARYQYKLKDAAGLKDYVVVTKGSYAGTVLYNGKKKLVDSNNDRYFGVEKY